MFRQRIALLRTRPFTAFAGANVTLLQAINKGPPRPSTLILTNRTFSTSHYFLVDNTKRYAHVSSHESPMFTMVKTTREDSVLKPGRDFSFHKVPRCLIPEGWTNDPYELECFLGMKLHEDYTSFPQNISPVITYMGNMVWQSYLLCDGSNVFDPVFYLVTFNQRVFRLDTSIELVPLLVCIKEGTVNHPGKNGEMPLALKTLLEHPELDWHELGPDQWTDKKKSFERFLNLNITIEDARQYAKECSVLKCPREEYVNWVGMCVMDRAEKHWEEIQDLLRRNDCPLQGTRWDGGEKLEAAWKEYAHSWEATEKTKAGEEHDQYVVNAELMRKKK